MRPKGQTTPLEPVETTREIPPQYSGIFAEPSFRRFLPLLADRDLGELMRIPYPEAEALVARMASPLQPQGPLAPEVLRRNLESNMVRIPAGTFKMGSQDHSSEQPIHDVTLSAFEIGATPVTQAQYEAIMGTNPSYFKDPDNPVEQVSWEDAMAFCAELRKKTGLEFTLPTEAQWEYACRAGSATRYCFGDNDEELGDYAWCAENSEGRTHPVGGRKPNACGLYDMHGNVWEWCKDDWHPNYSGAPADGVVWQSPESGSRVLRGGSWYGLPIHCRSADRDYSTPDNRSYDVGFRVVRTP